MTEIVNGASINKTHANVKRSRSKFLLKQRVMDTFRFAEYHPHFVFDSVCSDKLLMRSIHNARSYTLKAPLMQDIQMHKDYFYVPLRAILPFQAERIVTNPTLGDDVPSDAYTNVSGFIGKIKTFSDAFQTALSNLDSSSLTYKADCNTLCLKHLILLESIFSNGSLLASLGCNLNQNLIIQFSDGQYTASTNIDNVFDYIIGEILTDLGSNSTTVSIDNQAYTLVASSANLPKDFLPASNYITFREFLERIRDTSDWGFVTAGVSPLDNYYTDIWAFLNCTFTGTILDIDLARLWAYHLCHAEFYTNDKVDYIYSADLFRQYIRALYLPYFIGGSDSRNYDVFNWNGSELSYDYLSAHFFDRFSSFDYSNLSFANYRNSIFQYFLTLFGYHRSLRFKDYFTGARTRPLAVGDVNAPVVSNQVSVIDVTRKIQLQRYLNAVNSTGRKFGEYLKGIFGEAPTPDHHNPMFLAHTSDNIFAAEVENTGAAQWDASSDTGKNSVTAVFRGNSNKFAFQFDVKEPCIILGITSFDIERSYMFGIERSFFTKDRYDMFIPELQYVGDQAVYLSELFAGNGTMNPFGYQFRDMDRKQLINRAQGGFSAGCLPGYAFNYGAYIHLASLRLSPDFIRSRPLELDDFYLSLTGYSLGTYFHFIVSNDNIVEASRPMAVNPQILG